MDFQSVTTPRSVRRVSCDTGRIGRTSPRWSPARREAAPVWIRCTVNTEF